MRARPDLVVEQSTMREYAPALVREWMPMPRDLVVPVKAECPLTRATA